MQTAVIELHRREAGRASAGLGEQMGRDARVRVFAAAAVVLAHSAYPPGNPALAALPRGAQHLAAAVFALVVSFPVNAFVLLSFMSQAQRQDPGAHRRRMRAVARKLVPAHLFWTTAFLGAHAVHAHRLGTPRDWVEAYALGTAAAHLYFIPLLVALIAAAPALGRLARTPIRAAMGAVALALSAVALRAWAGTASPWTRALEGFLGMAPFAVAGLALAREWGGIGPRPADTRRTALLAGAVAVAAGVAVAAVRAVPEHGGDLGILGWVGLNAYALAVPVLLLTVRGPASRRTFKLALYSLGVYFVHPFFVQGLRAAEPSRAAALLVVPNALGAALLSVAAVAVLSRTPLRRVVM